MDTTKEKSSGINKFWTVLGIVLCIVLIPILVVNCILLVRGYTDKGKVPTIGGIFPMIVLSDSMSGTFESGDLLICQQADPEDIEVGDVICFYDPMGNGTTTVTHRVVEIQTDDDGEIRWITRGDANNTEDVVSVPAENLAGVYKTHFSGLGSVALFMQTHPA